MNMSPREKRLYDVLADACKRGERCPTNKELGELVGLSSRTIVDVLGHLVNGGQIEINTYGNWRMVKVAGRSSEIPPSHFKRNPFKKSGGARSEEHASELQTLMRISYAVFCSKK